MARVSLGNIADLPLNSPQRIDTELGALCVVRTDDGVRAVANTCSHQQAELSEGDYDPDYDEIECPLHAATFNMVSGEATAPPASEPVQAYRVIVDGDRALIE